MKSQILKSINAIPNFNRIDDKFRVYFDIPKCPTQLVISPFNRAGEGVILLLERYDPSTNDVKTIGYASETDGITAVVKSEDGDGRILYKLHKEEIECINQILITTKNE